MVNKTVRVACAGLALVMAAATAGCSGNNPSDAAIVGGTSITQSDVDRNVDGLAEAFKLDASRINARNVVGAMITGLQAEQIAAENNITITNGQRDASLATDETGAQLLQVPDAKELAYDLADAQIVAQQIGVEQFTQRAKEINVKLNPRYGNFEQGQMTGETGSLSDPIAPATPQAP